MGIFDWLFGKKETPSEPKKDCCSKNEDEKNKTNSKINNRVENNELRIHEDKLEDIGNITHYKGNPFTGIMFTVYDKNQQIRNEIQMKDGLKNGFHKKYRFSGSLLSQFEYKNDSQIGVIKTFNNNGELISEKPFDEKKKENQKFQKEVFKILQDKVEDKVEEINKIKDNYLRDYHDNGKLSSETELRNGIPHGLGKSWDENGILNNEIIFENGIPIKSTWYHSNGTPKKEEFDEKGKIISKCWDEDGNEIKCE